MRYKTFYNIIKLEVGTFFCLKSYFFLPLYRNKTVFIYMKKKLPTTTHHSLNSTWPPFVPHTLHLLSRCHAHITTTTEKSKLKKKHAFGSYVRFLCVYLCILCVCNNNCNVYQNLIIYQHLSTTRRTTTQWKSTWLNIDFFFWSTVVRERDMNNRYKWWFPVSLSFGLERDGQLALLS